MRGAVYLDGVAVDDADAGPAIQVGGKDRAGQCEELWDGSTQRRSVRNKSK